MTYGPKREEATLQPVSGKAFPVYRGEVFRIVQVEGEQCVDFNAFNLHDYKEFFSASNTRANYGFHLKQGDLLWGVHSRNRPMYLIMEMPRTCVADLLPDAARLPIIMLKVLVPLRTEPTPIARILWLLVSASMA